MKNAIEPLFLAVIGLALIFGGNTGGCTLPVIGGVSPPFTSEAGKPCIFVTADLSAAGNQSLGKSHPGVLSELKNWTDKNGGEYRLDDSNVKDAPGESEDQWVRDAWRVADRAHPPSIVGAGKSRGFRTQPLPATPEALNKLLDPLK